MKKGKLAAVIALCAVAAVSVVSFAACGGSAESAELTGTYTAGTFTFMSSYPYATYKQLGTSVETLNTYSDGTYQLTVADKYLSGTLEFDSGNTGNNDVSTTVDRGEIVTVYFGAYTSTEEEGIISMTINAPTDVIYLSTQSALGTGYYNTMAWDDETMNHDETGYDASYNVVTTTISSAADYLAYKSFTAKTFTIDTTTNGFDYITL